MKNLTWQNPEQLFVAQELINKVKSKCCGIKVKEKNIQLINLSIEPKLDEWKKTIRNQDIQTGKHFFLKNEKEFLKKYHYSSGTIHQFILIAPDGKIVESHLPNASSGKLEKYLTEQL